MLPHARLRLPGLVLALALAPVARAQLVPEVPAGWRAERLDFPLSFAPDLDYRGFEELRFAPGMFAPESPSYFSYVFAVQLEGAHDIDVAFWQSFLESYYRGLCLSVGKGRGLEVDPETITVALEEESDHLTLATIEMVDAFVTGKPLRLRLELGSHPRPATTELFAIASPMHADAAVWRELRSIAERWRAARAAPVFLNHLYVVPGADTYAALASSSFLRDTFGVFESRRTVRRDTSYEGLYWYGERTYFEILLPGGASKRAPGTSGVAFGIEVDGGTEVLSGKLGEQGVRTFPGAVTRELDGEHLPWFDVMGIEAAHAESRLSLFSLEYDPRFLRGWHRDLAPKRQSIARRAVLQRYAAVLTQGERLFEDVVEVFLEIDSRERSRLDAVCRVFEYEVDAGADATVYRGPQVRLTVRESAGPGRITGFRMTLRREVEERRIELGTARLVLEGRTATLQFAGG